METETVETARKPLVGAEEGKWKDRPLGKCPPEAKEFAEKEKNEALMQVAVIQFARAAKKAGYDLTVWGMFCPVRALQLCCKLMGLKPSLGWVGHLGPDDFEEATRRLNVETPQV